MVAELKATVGNIVRDQVVDGATRVPKQTVIPIVTAAVELTRYVQMLTGAKDQVTNQLVREAVRK